MSFIDIAIIIALIYATWKGFSKGFIIELFTFLALFLGLYAGIHFSDHASSFLIEHFEIENQYLPTISFTIVFLLVGAMVFFGGKAIEKVMKVVQLSLVNKLLGIALGLLKMIFILGSIILLLESYDEKGDFISQKTKDDSILYEPIKKAVLLAIPAFEESTLFLKKSLVDGIELKVNVKKK